MTPCPHCGQPINPAAMLRTRRKPNPEAMRELAKLSHAKRRENKSKKAAEKSAS